MSGMYHDVRTVKRRPFGVVIEERTTSGKHIPGVIHVKIQHAQPKSKMNAGHRIAIIGCNELTLREDLSVVLEFFEGVGFLGGVNQLAYLDNGLVVQGFNETDSIVGRKHGGSYPIARCRESVWFWRISAASAYPTQEHLAGGKHQGRVAPAAAGYWMRALVRHAAGDVTEARSHEPSRHAGFHSEKGEPSG